MKTGRHAHLLALASAFVSMALWSHRAAANSALPPLNHTGAPGHQTCASCHTSAGQGEVSLSFSGGLEYEPGEIYDLMVAIRDPGQRRFGFSMVARDFDNSRVDAGTWTAGPSTRVHGPGGNHVSHSPAVFADGSHTFTVTWTAPAEGVGDVTFYVAANAANGNGSSGAGDRVYLSQLTISESAGPNQAPSLLVPGGPVMAIQGQMTPIEGISVEDADAGAGEVTLALSVEHGSLILSDAVDNGVGPDEITDNGTGMVAVTASLEAINTMLAAPNGLVFQSDADFVGEDALLLQVNDNGNTGSGGSKTFEASVPIVVEADPSLGQGGPRLSDLMYVDGEGFQFTLEGIPGRSYFVFVSDDLMTWELLQQVTLELDATTITDPESVDFPFRCYRAAEEAVALDGID
ncbi:MAG TPA: Reeler domain-containing protein [Verrucomicrobiales bacterium]|nr:Reeler domain-containing protein [Verrucomicrobiales bacterium]